MVTFCKSVDCPSSEKLLSFQEGGISDNESRNVRRHLSECEFCTSEVEFYARYPQSKEAVKPAEIPFPLYQLAEVLLSNKHKDFNLLNRLLNENDNLILEKA